MVLRGFPLVARHGAHGRRRAVVAVGPGPVAWRWSYSAPPPLLIVSSATNSSNAHQKGTADGSRPGTAADHCQNTKRAARRVACESDRRRRHPPRSHERERIARAMPRVPGVARRKPPAPATWRMCQEARGRPFTNFSAGISRSRAIQGFSPAETATFVFSLKQPLFTRLRREVSDAQALADESVGNHRLLDKLGLYTTEMYQKTREEVIARQQQEMLELSTPVVKLWKDILALPLIGTLDSARTQVVMESLLQKIVETGAAIAIIDITGVPTVDTLVAQHLLKTVAAARLMGADCIISGIRPQIAQTIVHLGVDLLGHHQGHPRGCLPDRSEAHSVAAARTKGARRLRTRHGKNSDSEDGPVPAGHHPGGHARPAGPAASGRSDRADRGRRGARRADRHLRRWRSSIPSSAA